MTTVHRVDYSGEGLTEAELAPTPWQQARRWVDEADARAEAGDDVPEPRALSVATVDASGAPNVRTVLMRFFDERGPGFVTSRDSTKGVELANEPRVAAALVWPAMFRAVRFRGVVEEVAGEEVHAYWASRPWGSRISAWASRQSRPATGREQLEADFDRYAAQFPDHGSPDDVPVPELLGRLSGAVPGGRVLGGAAEPAARPAGLHRRGRRRWRRGAGRRRIPEPRRPGGLDGAAPQP